MVTLENYQEMLVLYMKHSRNRVLIHGLTKKVNVEKLNYELRKIFPENKPVNKEVKPYPVTVVKLPEITIVDQPEKLKVIRNKREVFYDDLPKKLQILWDQNRDDYKEIRSLHEKLKLMENATSEDRSLLTLRICDLDQEIRNRWNEIDKWQPVPDDKKIDHKRISSNRKFISVYLDKLDTLDKESNEAKIIIANLQERFDELALNSVDISRKTLEELKKWGVKVDGTDDGGSDS